MIRDLHTCRAHASCGAASGLEPGHCREHTVEWYAIEADQREILKRATPPTAAELADLKARRFAMNMAWPPRNFRGPPGV